MALLAYIRSRLFFLVHNDVLFHEVEKLAFRKSKASFRIFYVKANNGCLFDYREHKDGRLTLQFPTAIGGSEIVYKPSVELDETLLKAFKQRVSEAGVTFEEGKGRALRTIIGGQGGSTTS